MTDAPHTTVERVVENAWLKVVARIIMPLVVVGFAGAGSIIGWFAIDTLSGLRKDISEVKTFPDRFEHSLEEQRKTFWAGQQSLTSSMATFNVRLGVLGEKVDQNTKRIDRLEVDQFKTYPKP